MTKPTMPPYIWQCVAWTSFMRQVQMRALPHALLVCGPDGTGIEKLGRAMAHYLLCRSPLETVACGSCKACQLVAAGSHPDLMEVAPAEPGKAIRVDQIRELTDFVAKTAQQGGRKLVLISPADAMNVNAANSLLKCLEEPAGDTVLILISSAISQLMPTIRSRCAKIDVAAPKLEQSIRWLEDMGVKDADVLLQETGNAPLKALDWWQNNTFQRHQQMCKGLADLSLGVVTVSELSKAWAGLGALECVNTLLSWMERIIRARHQVQSSAVAWTSLIRATQTVPEPVLFRYRDALCARKHQLQRSANLNATLVIEELLVDWRAMLMASSRTQYGKISL